MENPGMRIVQNFIRPSKEEINQFIGIPAANVADATNRMFASNADLKPMGKGKKLLGPAFTVKSAMADNFMFHKAISMAQPGDVIVVNACGDRNYSVCGDVMFRYAISRGIAGFVIDGCIRDMDFLEDNDFPVYSLGVTPRGPYKSPVGEINTDIACCGQVVHPGDVIAGDQDGIVVIRKEDIAVTYAKVQKVLEKEELMGHIIDSGEWEQKSPILTFVNEQIAKAGFEIK